MIPYITYLFLSVILFFLYEQLKIRKKAGAGLFYLLTLVVIVCFSSFRAFYVGTDTGTYIMLWINSPDDLISFISIQNFFTEPLYGILSFITKKLSYSYFGGRYLVLLFFIALLVCGLNLSSICRYSPHRTLSFIVFLLLGFYTFHFNGARQAIAISIFLFSLRYIINSNLNKYLICLLIGFLFHKTILICLPFYYFFRKPLTVKMVAVIVFTSIIMALFINSLVEYASSFDQRYSGYADNEFEGGGAVTTIYYFGMLFWLFFAKSANSINSKMYDISLLSMCIVACFTTVSVILNLNPSGMLRLSGYFSQLLIIAIPMSIYSFKAGISRVSVMTLAVFFMVLYFYFTTTSFSNLYPYQLGIDL